MNKLTNKTPKKLLVIGMGGQGKVIGYTAHQMDNGIEIYYLDKDDKQIEYTYLGDITKTGIQNFTKRGGNKFVCAIGDNKLRKKFSELAISMGLSGFTIMHPNSVIAPDVKIGEGTVVFANAVIHPGSTIGKNVIVNTGVQVDHDNTIEDYAQLAPGVITGGEVIIRENSMIGMGAILTPGITIGSNVLIGAGSVVLTDIKDSMTAWGVPAREIQSNNSDQ